MPRAAAADQAKGRTVAGRASAPPTAGALLRMTYQDVRNRQLAALMQRGFDDLNPALMNVFLYPPPDRMRPGDLAERANMTKQAMNYLLGQLEARGYVERRAEGGNNRRLVFLTDRGWRVRDIILAVVTEVEAAWASTLGQRRFDDFMQTLRQLGSIGLDRQSTAERDTARGGDQPARTRPQSSGKPSRVR